MYSIEIKKIEEVPAREREWQTDGVMNEKTGVLEDGYVYVDTTREKETTLLLQARE